ncbi:MAG: hypothetical protein ACLSEX_10600 [Blautia sp.]
MVLRKSAFKCRISIIHFASLLLNQVVKKSVIPTNHNTEIRMPGRMTLVFSNSLLLGTGKPLGSKPSVGHISRTGTDEGQSHQELLSATVATPPIDKTMQEKTLANIPNLALRNRYRGISHRYETLNNTAPTAPPRIEIVVPNITHRLKRI